MLQEMRVFLLVMKRRGMETMLCLHRARLDSEMEIQSPVAMYSATAVQDFTFHTACSRRCVYVCVCVREMGGLSAVCDVLYPRNVIRKISLVLWLYYSDSPARPLALFSARARTWIAKYTPSQTTKINDHASIGRWRKDCLSLYFRKTLWITQLSVIPHRRDLRSSKIQTLYQLFVLPDKNGYTRSIALPLWVLF